MQLRPSQRPTRHRFRTWGAVPMLVFFAIVVVFARGAGAQALVGARGGQQTAGAWAISELRIDQPGSDVDEYAEIAGLPGGSLAGMTYLVLGDDGASSGVVEAIVDLDLGIVPAEGLFVVAEPSFSLGTQHLTAALNFENGDNVTHLLVDGFTGGAGDDLDADDDGTLEITPWTSVVDCVALLASATSGDRVYCPVTLGPTQGTVPGHAYRCADGWRVGPFDPVGGLDSPAADNSCSDSPPTPTAEPTVTPEPLPTATPQPSNVSLAGTELKRSTPKAGVWAPPVVAMMVLAWAGWRQSQRRAG